MIESIEQGRMQDGNRSIADKIIKRLHDLEKTIEHNYGRWVWELMQNAKDSITDDSRSVDIFILKNENNVIFGHNGNHFTEQDIRGLINQISSKEVEDGEKSTKVGKFGTGFITTHLLSKVVTVKGIVQTQNNELYQFEFPIDRTGSTTAVLAPKIESTWAQFHQSTKRILSADINELNTFFSYTLNNDNQRTTARKGIEEFIRLIPFVLAFIPKIGKVKIINESRHLEFERQQILINEIIVQILRTENKLTQNIQIAIVKNKYLESVAVEIDPVSNSVMELKNIPRLFCDFPLIGTEKFYFPAIINSFYFNPQTERDGIWLKGNEDKEVIRNQEILVDAVQLFQNLLNKLSILGVKKLYYSVGAQLPDVNEKYFDSEWYTLNILKPLRDAIIKIPIIDTVRNGRISIEESEEKFVLFPHHFSNKTRERLWLLGAQLNKSNLIMPVKDSIDFWDNVIWDKKYYLDVEKYAILLTQWIKNIDDFNLLTSQNEFEWLNEFYSLLLEERKLDLINQFEIIPNQNGFLNKANWQHNNNRIIPILYNDEINDDTLLQIQKLIGNDWKDNLIHKEISVALTSSALRKQDIASQISTFFTDNKKDWDINSVNAIILLTEWFENNRDQGKDLFPELYRKRAELFMNTIVDKESLYQVMKSKTSLSILADIAEAIQNDPEILNIIAKRKQEILEEKERIEIGEAVESILAEVLIDSGFSIQKVHYGRDLVISLNGKLSYDIEVKSTNSGDFVTMTSYQSQTAVKNQNKYALCVVHKNGNVLTKEFIRQNAKFVINIGSLLTRKLEMVNSFNHDQSQLFQEIEGIGLLVESPLDYKYKISSGIWSNGIDIQRFINYIQRIS